jgi:hypothetical protein
MANRNKHRLRRQFSYSLRQGLTKLQGNLEFGSAGAIASDGYNLRGLDESSTSGPAATKLGTGKYRLRFADSWLGLSGFSFAFEHATATDGYNVLVLDSSKIASDKYVDLQVVNASNAAADPIDCKMWLEFSLRTSENG